MCSNLSKVIEVVSEMTGLEAHYLLAPGAHSPLLHFSRSSLTLNNFHYESLKWLLGFLKVPLKQPKCPPIGYCLNMKLSEKS